MKKIPHFAIATAAAFALAAAPALAKTTNWTGAAGTAASPSVFSEAANWDNGAPEPGDTVVLKTSNLYLTNAVPFDIGSAGLTISASYQTYFKFGFTGSGSLEFTGKVRHVIQAVSTHTGGTIVRNGYLDFNAGNPNPMGTGPITLYQASATRPYLSVSGSEKTFANKLVLRGDPSLETWMAFDSVMGKSFDSIESNHDFTIQCTERGLVVDNGISAPGKTVTFLVSNSKALSALKHETDIYGAIDANVVVQAYGSNPSNKSIVRFYGESTVATNTLNVASGTNILQSAAVWAGTNITIGATATLSLNGAGNLSPAAHLTVAEGGTIEVANNVTVQIAALTVGGTDLLPGIYTAATLPGTISGNGKLLVLGDSPFVWTGADEDNPTQWSVAANWKGNTVPGDGAVVYFSADAVVSNTASTVAVGASGLTFVLGGTVDLRDPLTGSGALTVTGTGRLNLDDAATHTGGTTISGSAVLVPYSTDDSPLGTGTVTIDGANGGVPGIRIASWSVKIPNDVVVYGAITNRNSQYGYGCIDNPQFVTISGNLIGNDDIMLYCSAGSETVNGNIAVPAGKTIRLKNVYNGSTASRVFAANGTLTGNLSVEGTWWVQLGANSSCSGDVLVGSTGKLRLKAAGNLAETAVVSVETGGLIDIASDVMVQVAELYVGGVQQPHGVYNATNLPAVIAGSGKLQAGPTTATVISFR